MEIVIDIPDQKYKWIVDNPQAYTDDLCEAIRNGTPLPEQQPCEDCISREAIIKIFGEVHPMDYNTLAYIKNIQNLPSVTPTRSKGKWIHWTDDYKDYVTCSCCGYGEEGEVLLSDKTPFCPICGADMRINEE